MVESGSVQGLASPVRPAGAELCRHRAHATCSSPAWSCSTCSRWCSSPRSSPSTCCATGTGWWRRCAASCRRAAPAPGRRLAERDRPGAGRLPARPGHGLPVPRPASTRSAWSWSGSTTAPSSACSPACSRSSPMSACWSGVAVGLTVAIFQFGAVCPVAWWRPCSRSASSSRAISSPPAWWAPHPPAPVWVIFAVLAGTALFGLVGTFLATPVAAVIAVLVRFGVERWRRSDYFREDTSLPDHAAAHRPGAAPPRS